ncbi:MAG TPA: glycosyltransferase family 4 protein [Phycisphaerae bacterium]|nr:glycosyltransferase family 4 protein [Phycisphaerae bacterium]
MRVVYLAAGAGGMYCGSCMRDHRLVATLITQGRDILLVPLYTPIRTDELSVGRQRIFYGGINVFLEQKWKLFRHAPSFVGRILDSPILLGGVGRLATKTQAGELGALTVSVLKGEQGAQRKELEKLVAGLRHLEPDLINLPNLMFVGIARRLTASLGVPVLCTLSGEDVFLDALAEPFRTEAFALIRERAQDVHGLVALTDYYAAHAVEHFGLPGDRVHRVRMGVRVDDIGEPADPPDEPFTIGYLARICPQKGLARLCEALALLRRAGRNCRLRVAGYSSAGDWCYYQDVYAVMCEQGVADAFEYVGEVNRQQKLEFLRTLHALSVPTTYPEPKGLYVLEALAGGVPVVQPRHGSFPELVEATGGGLLCEPNSPQALADTLGRLMDDSALRRCLTEQGRAAVHESFTDEVMAEQTWSLYQQYCGSRTA